MSKQTSTGAYTDRSLDPRNLRDFIFYLCVLWYNKAKNSEQCNESPVMYDSDVVKQNMANKATKENWTH